MNKVANTYWIDSRLAAQRPAARAVQISQPRSLANVIDTRSGANTAARQRTTRIVSPMTMFAMVIVAMCALCWVVTLRTQTGMQTAAAHYDMMSKEVESLRNTNQQLKVEVQRLHTDSQAIEAAARTQLGMVRANEIIVPVR